MLTSHDQELLYIPGKTVHHAASTYRGDGKTDAKDAAVIADQARVRRDLQLLRAGDVISANLRLLTARRADLVIDRTRPFNRRRAKAGAIKAELIAEPAVGAAHAQHTVVRSQDIASHIVAELAMEILRLHENVTRVDRDIESLCRQHEDGEVATTRASSSIALRI